MTSPSDTSLLPHILTIYWHPQASRGDKDYCCEHCGEPQSCFWLRPIVHVPSGETHYVVVVGSFLQTDDGVPVFCQQLDIGDVSRGGLPFTSLDRAMLGAGVDYMGGRGPDYGTDLDMDGTDDYGEDPYRYDVLPTAAPVHLPSWEHYIVPPLSTSTSTSSSRERLS